MERTRPSNAHLPLRSDLGFILWLTAALFVLLGMVSLAGLLLGPSGLYADDGARVAFLGQDAITIVATLPLLLVSSQMLRRGSVRGLVLYMGSLAYIAYSYYFYVAGAKFGVLFLAEAAIVAMSFYGLIAILLQVEPKAFATHVGAGARPRLAAGVLLAIAALFALMWTGMIVGSAASGDAPTAVVRTVLAIDLVILLPPLAVIGALLWRRRDWGFALAGPLLVTSAGLGLTLAINQAAAIMVGDVAGGFEIALIVIFGGVGTSSLTALIPYVRALDACPPALQPSSSDELLRRVPA